MEDLVKHQKIYLTVSIMRGHEDMHRHEMEWKVHRFEHKATLGMQHLWPESPDHDRILHLTPIFPTGMASIQSHIVRTEYAREEC